MIKFKEIPDDEKPRERCKLYGTSILSNEELLMIILKTGTKKKSVKELAIEVLSKCHGLDNLKAMNINDLKKIEGIGEVKAIEIASIIELAKRMNKKVKEKDLLSFTNPTIIVNYFEEMFDDKKQEEFYCIYLDNKKKYIAKKKLFIGTINHSVVHPREIFKEAYLLSASYILCIHNHPSGDPTPSKEDDIITNNLKTLGELHSIYLVDHLIIGKNCYYSYYENKNILNCNHI